MPSVHRAILKPMRTGARGSLFSVTVNGIEIVSGSRQPIFDACRELRTRGLSGSLELFHADSDILAMRICIEHGAKLSILESDKHGPRFSTWKPFDPTQRAVMMIPAHPSEQDDRYPSRQTKKRPSLP